MVTRAALRLPLEPMIGGQSQIHDSATWLRVVIGLHLPQGTDCLLRLLFSAEIQQKLVPCYATADPIASFTMIGTRNTINMQSSAVYRHEPLSGAGKIIVELMERDHKFLDLADLLRGPTSEKYIKSENIADDCYTKSHVVHMPDDLLELVDQLNCRCFMGVLPEIGRAWMTVDNRLYLWNYVDGTDVYTYADQDQIISNVALIKPRAGVFGDHIRFVLVVTTPVEVILLAVSLNNFSVTNPQSSENRGLTLYATDLSASADDKIFLKIVGSDDGRCFMVGDDGHLYELIYSHPQKWFSTPCRIVCQTKNTIINYLPTFFGGFSREDIKSIAIDNERKVLYTLTNKSTISVAYIGDQTSSIQFVAQNTDICNSAQLMCRHNSMLYESKHFEIESMHVVSKSESQKIHLMAVTYSGFRLYFTHHRDALRHSALAATRTRPDSLELVHVRLPPPIQPIDQNILQQGPGSINIGTSFYDRGAFLASKCGQDEHDSILMASTRIGALPNNQTTPAYSMGFQNNLAETSAVTSSDGKVWAIAETSSRLRDQTDPNEIAEQLTVPPRQFVVLTTTSLTFFHKQRPVDTLYHLLVKANGNIETDKASFASFFNRYGKTQACAMCLAVICANLGATTPEQADVVRGATKLFFEYGGVPSASGAAFDSSYLQSMTATGLQFSGKHDGFALYFSRLIRPLWKTKLFEQSDKPTPIAKYTQLQAAFTNVQWSLSRLKEFMDVNTAFHTLSSIADARLLSSDEVHAQVLLKEQQSLHELYLLLTQCIDAISFVDFLIDSGIEEIFQCVTDSSKIDLREITVESMVTTTRGRALSRQLVIAAINKYGRTQAHVGFDVVSDLLQRKCSSFFGPNDVSFYKGVENMRRAHHAEAEYERGRCLTESLKYFKEASDYLTEEQLDEISKEYGQQGFHVGTIELAIERAQRLDPQQQALSYLESNAPENDQRLYFYETRIKCYQYVFRTLTEVKNMRDNPKQVPQNSKIHDPYSHAARAFSAALAHRDKLFHYALYDWFIRMDMKADLLAVDTEYLIPFFRDRVDAVIGLDFLWQYCRRREQYFEAALYLEELALRSKGLGLLKRVEYLSLAVVNARCRDPKRQLWQESTQLLQYLEERVEVARLQVRLHQTLQNYGPETAEVAKDLEERLMDLHELSKYQEYINK